MRVLVRKLLRPKILLSFGLLAGGVGLSVIFYRYNQTPGVGVVHPATREPKPEVESVSTAHFNGSAIAFDYSADYTTVENNAVASGSSVKEVYSLKKHNPTIGSSRISITVKNTSGGAMLEDSAYKLRTIKADEYKASDVTLPRYAVKKMTKKDGSEITYFIPGKIFYAIIASTSTHPSEDLEKEVTSLVKSFVWR